MSTIAQRVSSTPTVVIIGAGFSGTMVAVHLLRRADAPLRVVVLEPRGVVGRGVAYGTAHQGHLLNVPAGRMGAFPDDEEHFLHFARVRSRHVTSASFVSRSTYGAYLEATLRDAAFEATSMGHQFELIADSAVALHRTPNAREWIVRLTSGQQLTASQVVLAIGNAPPADLAAIEPDVMTSRQFVADPWAPNALDDVSTDAPVFLIGTGLTMVDVALQLLDTHGVRRVYAMSRRGLLPQPHRPHGAPPSYAHLPPGLIACTPSVRAYLGAIRTHVRRVEREAVDWREVLNSLRPVTARLWETLDDVERRRFLRHVLPYWDTHRHRIPADVWMRIEAHRQAGGLQVHAGRLLGAARVAGDVAVQWRRRGQTHEEHLAVGTLINCTGPANNVRQRREPLIQSLLAAGQVRPDPTGLGIDVDEALRPIGATGIASPSLRLVGPLLKGRFWEATAVPELRTHALRAAQAIVAELAQG